MSEKEQLEKLKTLLKAYLNHPSADGHVNRQILRKELANLINQ